MTEHHKLEKDGVLGDGVSHYPASAEDLATYSRANTALSQFQAPILIHAGNPNEKLFIAAFDGTGNDVFSDPEHATNVAGIRSQIKHLNRDGNDQIEVGYVIGPGTQKNALARTLDGADGHTYNERLEDMYRQFIEKASEWKAENPDAQIRVADVGFSRGAEQAAGFSRLVHERGIQDPDGAVYKLGSHGEIKSVAYNKEPIVEPGQVAQAVGLFDPVGTGDPVKHQDRRLPPSVISGVQIIAEDERRGLFKSTHIIDPGQTSDGRLLGVTVAGAHSDIGGSYHRDGLATRSGNLMTDYVNALSDKPFLDKRAEPSDPRLNVVHRSEEGMLLYKWGSKVDRLQPEGYVERLVPKHMVDKVLDPNNAEPIDQSLRAKFPQHAVQIGAVPGNPQPTRTESMANPASALGQGDAALYQALRDKLPASMDNDRVMQATLRARQEGIAPGALGGATEHNGSLWVVGTTTGYRAQIDLSQPAPPMQDSMRQLQSLNAPSQQRPTPTLAQEPPSQQAPVRALQ
ncbi:Uncharacterized alpha/beta hydrolase domain [Pseudoxanthomonas sp. GM95]|uniref:phospholipase effector Tle1 domain-containing protein n=1 Tax=Pseudoxanthomonas sp. GM95 TaxID=1881043 RepID=UPI0008AD7BD0|nr:DUF2235 domain-containing protein [Pseudoxanthomonas sp. GM95]SEM25548.1 Uncharacterized alpha/beta hydrolase domain [Pseudoxanthomonas sp. GM95]